MWRAEGMETRTSWVQGVNVNGQVDGLLRPNSIPNLLDHARGPDLIYLSRLHDLKSAVPIIVIIAQAAQRRPDTGVDIRIVGQQALLVRVVEVGAVVDGGLFGGGAAEDFGAPGVEVRVEVDDADGPVGFVDGAEEGERDGVVAA